MAEGPEGGLRGDGGNYWLLPMARTECRGLKTCP